jgi:hypothetical protein
MTPLTTKGIAHGKRISVRRSEEILQATIEEEGNTETNKDYRRNRHGGIDQAI